MRTLSSIIVLLFAVFPVCAQSNIDFESLQGSIGRICVVSPYVHHEVSSGTCFIYKIDHDKNNVHLITAGHVMYNPSRTKAKVCVWLYYPDVQLYVARMDQYVYDQDTRSTKDYALCTIKVSSSVIDKLRPLQFHTKEIDVGDTTFIYGAEGCVTPSIKIGKVRQKINEYGYIKITPPTLGGGSGSPVFLKNGKVVGMVTMCHKDSYTLAIHSSKLKPILD